MASTRAWQAWLPGLVLLSALLVLFRVTAADMVHIWIRSETYQHAFLVLPISIWLAWRKRSEIGLVAPQPAPWMLLPMAATCFVWLLGELADVAAATHLALVTLIVLAVPALFGWRLARVLAFPLLFLYFMVPFGEFAVPYLQKWTADVTVWALRLTGIPVYREGMQFVIPSGTWSVIAACSGIRYIIACFMVGTLFAYLNYQSPRRRAAFVVASLLVPIVANWIRAYTIVMIGHVTGSPMILGVEHTTYGWFLFGAVVMVMFWVGTRWAEYPEATPNCTAIRGVDEDHAGRGLRSTMVLAGAALLLVTTHLWAWSLQRQEPLPAPRVELPASMGDWQPDPARTSLDWVPGFQNPSSAILRSYRNKSDQVQVWVGYYRQQSEERKLVTSVHNVVATHDNAWRDQSTGRRAAANGLPAFNTSIVSPGSAPSLTATARQRAWYLYWLEGRWMIRPAEIKLRQAFGRLIGHGDDGAIVMLVTPLGDDADAVMDKFAREHLPAIEAALEATRKSRTSKTL